MPRRIRLEDLGDLLSGGAVREQYLDLDALHASLLGDLDDHGVPAVRPQDVINEVKKFIDYGTDHLVFDFRLRPDDYDEQIAWVARDVLPAVKELATKARA
jgi:hypothetical protein